MFNKELFKKNFNNVVTNTTELSWLTLWGLTVSLSGLFDIPFIPSIVGLIVILQLVMMSYYPEEQFTRFSLKPKYFNLLALYRPIWIAGVLLLVFIGGTVTYGVIYA